MNRAALPVSVTLLAKNAERHLARCLDALRDIDQIVLLDNGSHDATPTIAAQYPNVLIIRHGFIGFGALKNLAAQHARHDWILNIDSDEIVSDVLLDALAQLDFSDQTKIYTVSRLNHYRGRAIRGCGWYPDIVPRLYHRRHTAFSDAAVHERIMLRPDSRVTALTGDLLHYSYEGGAAELIGKMQFYTDLYARQHAGKKSATTAQAVTHGLFAFIKSYVFKRGFLYGGDGWVIAASIAANSYYKYIKLKEANGQRP